MLSEEQKRRLEQAGWECAYEGEAPITQWRMGATLVTVSHHPKATGGPSVTVSDYEEADLLELVEFAAILGYAPRGYRLVPEDHLQRCITAVTAISGDPNLPFIDQVCLSGVEDLLSKSLASSLSPKEEDKPHE